jgi:hypothetical protein
MSRKRALVYPDKQSVKIIFGSTVKKIDQKDFDSEASQRFIEKIFSSFDVFVATEAVIVGDSEQMKAALHGQKVGQKAPADAGYAGAATFSHAQEQMPAAPAPSSSPPVGAAPGDALPAEGPPVSDVDILSGHTTGVFLKSNAKTAIVIDDLPPSLNSPSLRTSFIAAMKRR